jgi:hypothetical protein
MFPSSVLSLFFVVYFVTLSLSRFRLQSVNGRMIDELKDLVQRSFGLAEVLSQHMPGRTEKTENIRQDGQFNGRDLNCAPPKYKSGALLINHPALVSLNSYVYHQ